MIEAEAWLVEAWLVKAGVIQTGTRPGESLSDRDRDAAG